MKEKYQALLDKYIRILPLPFLQEFEALIKETPAKEVDNQQQKDESTSGEEKAKE